MKDRVTVEAGQGGAGVPLVGSGRNGGKRGARGMLAQGDRVGSRAHIPAVVVEAGQVLRELRLSKGAGLREFAEMAGVSAGYLSKVEGGLAHAPSVDTLNQMEFLLGLEPYRLVELFGKLPGGPCKRCAGRVVVDSEVAQPVVPAPVTPVTPGVGQDVADGAKVLAQRVLDELTRSTSGSTVTRVLMLCRKVLSGGG